MLRNLRKRKVKKQMETLKSKLKKCIMDSLSERNWGVYSKVRPLESFPVNGEDNVYKVNSVDDEAFVNDVLYRIMDS